MSVRITDKRIHESNTLHSFPVCPTCVHAYMPTCLPPHRPTESVVVPRGDVKEFCDLVFSALVEKRVARVFESLRVLLHLPREEPGEQDVANEERHYDRHILAKSLSLVHQRLPGYTHTCTHTHTNTHTQPYTHVATYTHTATYAHAATHTHPHTHTHVCVSSTADETIAHPIQSHEVAHRPAMAPASTPSVSRVLTVRSQDEWAVEWKAIVSSMCVTPCCSGASCRDPAPTNSPSQSNRTHEGGTPPTPTHIHKHIHTYTYIHP
eukprot:GHVU01065340.1.p1 GENE.GHVU01065340.1~~GHVU01065340.1.p1  ORF type:complete len:265 (-),score=15.66 GHVU01065340.1:30-824(-)